jgi:hypothetical protein
MITPPGSAMIPGAMSRALLLALFALSGCATTLKNDKTVCAEYREPRCNTAPGNPQPWPHQTR